MAQCKEPIQFDNRGRMLYHPDYHPNYKESWTKGDLIYLCKYWEVDHSRSLSFALGRPEESLVSKVYRLRKNGKYDYYKNLELECEEP